MPDHLVLVPRYVLNLIVLYQLTLNSYWIISEEEAEEKKLAPIEVVYVGAGSGKSPKTGRKGMHRLLYTFNSFFDASEFRRFI